MAGAGVERRRAPGGGAPVSAERGRAVSIVASLASGELAGDALREACRRATREIHPCVGSELAHELLAVVVARRVLARRHAD